MQRMVKLGLMVAPLLAVMATGSMARADQLPVAGAQPVGVSVDETMVVAKGWSAKKSILGKQIYNDKGEKIGAVEDIIVAPDKTTSFAIIGTGGFVGLDRHDVAVPFSQINLTGSHLVLPNATKEALKAAPAFQYAR